VGFATPNQSRPNHYTPLIATLKKAHDKRQWLIMTLLQQHRHPSGYNLRVKTVMLQCPGLCEPRHPPNHTMARNITVEVCGS
jgi:hypothetical protein